MDDEFLDHQLRRLAQRRPPAAPEGIEAEVWRRIGLRTAALPLYLSARSFCGGLALAAGIGLLLPLALVNLLESGRSGESFDHRLFSIEAPALPSTRIALKLQ